MSAGAGFGRSVRNGAIAGAIIVAAAAAAVAFVPGLLDRPPERVERFVLVVAGPGEDGVTGARIIAEVDLTGEPEVTALDPARKATIQGTSYNRLSDAYAFGGGAGVAEAAYPGAPPVHVSVTAETFETLAEDAGGIDVDVPRDMEVFTGEELLSFPTGRARLSGTEAIWILQGARYLPAGERTTLRTQVAEETLRVVSEAPGGIAGLLDREEAVSDATPEALRSAMR